MVERTLKDKNGFSAQSGPGRRVRTWFPPVSHEVLLLQTHREWFQQTRKMSDSTFVHVMSRVINNRAFPCWFSTGKVENLQSCSRYVFSSGTWEDVQLGLPTPTQRGVPLWEWDQRDPGGNPRSNIGTPWGNLGDFAPTLISQPRLSCRLIRSKQKPVLPCPALSVPSKN